LSPDVSQVLPGLFRFIVPFPHDERRKVNSFLFVANGEALLLDASWNTPPALEALEATLALSGLGLEAVRTVVITHLHPDHLGLAGRLRRLGARIGYHPAEAVVLLTRYRRLAEFRAHSLFWERLNGSPIDEFPSPGNGERDDTSLREVPEPDLPLEGGERLELGDFRLRPVWTPGHTMGHLCYYEESRKLLFTGDHVLPTISPHVGLYMHAIGNPLSNYLESLRLLQSYQPALVLPAHGENFTDLHARLDELLEHHHERMEELLAIVGTEPLTAWQVASRAHWTRRKVTLDEISAWHRRLALAETMAHLDLLQAEGRIKKQFVPGLIRYWRDGAG
jgi:glyoxylase-like metal-dependent hydrolase (beta-lactamase superfamily II)